MATVLKDLKTNLEYLSREGYIADYYSSNPEGKRRWFIYYVGGRQLCNKALSTREALAATEAIIQFMDVYARGE